MPDRPIPTDETSLLNWITTQRWFGDKSRTVSVATVTSWSDLAIGERVVHALDVAIEFADGASSRYFVPLLDGDEPCDALADESVLRWFVSGFAERRELTLPSGKHLKWDAIGDDGWTEGVPTPITGEQSNSSFFVGDQAIVKVFRRVQEGLNPDSEIVSALTQRGNYAGVPAFLGSIELQDGASSPIEVAAVQSLVHNDGDCWRWLPGAIASASDEDLPGLVDAVALLGSRTGELHCALANIDDPEFTPREIDPDSAKDIVNRLAAEIALTLPMIKSSGRVPSAQFGAFQQALATIARNASDLTGTFLTRVHGDYHLGQVLRADGDFVIIDFEGEPSRSMTERRQRHSPLKDVAGMVRSLDYAVASVTLGETPELRQRLLTWRNAATAAFVSAYQSTVGAAVIDLVPRDTARFDRCLDAYMVEKALYEVRYELDNRPDWIDIPLGSLLDVTRIQHVDASGGA